MRQSYLPVYNSCLYSSRNSFIVVYIFDQLGIPDFVFLENKEEEEDDDDDDDDDDDEEEEDDYDYVC